MKVRLLHRNNTIHQSVITTDNCTGNAWVANGLAIIYEREAKDKMVYYNQYNKKWANIPYPSANHPKATVQTSGCGTTAGAMVIATLSDKKITPIDITKYSLKNGYRALEGTSEQLFPALAKKYNLDIKQTYNLIEMVNAVKKGGISICLMNDWFRDGSGHYIVVHKIVGKSIMIKDPASTFNSVKLFSKDLFARKGNGYFIFTKKPKIDQFVETIKYLSKYEIDEKYWLKKRKIDKYFPALMIKLADVIKKLSK